MPTLSGTVTDSDGTGIDGATVTITATGASSPTAESTTDASGNYSASVPSDSYDVRATKDLYDPVEKTNVSVTSDTTVNLQTSRVDYKVLGELTDLRGIGVLGRNESESGTPKGVVGETPNADGYGLYTLDDTLIEGVVDTNDTDFVVEGATTDTSGASNVVLGHANNQVGSVLGATISGGGFDDGNTDNRNEVNADHGTIGGGEDNLVEGSNATVGGGDSNEAYGGGDSVGGGNNNRTSTSGTGVNVYATVAGGSSNEATDTYSTVGGGFSNAATADEATVGGGRSNEATAKAATIAGGGTFSTVLGGPSNNVVYDQYGAIGGGAANRAGGDTDSTSGTFATVSGGRESWARGRYSSVGGGLLNFAYARTTTVAGGNSNVAWGENSAIGGGNNNTTGTSGVTELLNATIAGGGGNEAYQGYDAIGGGELNRTGTSGSTANLWATIPGGKNNIAEGAYSFAAGRKAEATNAGTFVWSDASDTSFESTIAGQFLIDASNGVGIGTNSTPHERLTVKGNNDTAGFWSDHLVGFESISDGGDVLALRNSAESDPGSDTNFITFFDSATSSSIGAVQGTGGGIEYVSGNKDLAEYFPKADPDAEFSPGDVVGLREGAAVADPTEGEAALVVSGSPMVTGNVPDEDREGKFVCLALTGQVPVSVGASVGAGEVLVADEDGTAVPAEKSSLADPLVVGLTLGSAEDGQVRTLVGGHGLDAASVRGAEDAAGEDQAADDPQDEEGRVEDLEAALDRIEALETEVDRKDERIRTLEDRLSRLANHVGFDDRAGDPAVSDD